MMKINNSKWKNEKDTLYQGVWIIYIVNDTDHKSDEVKFASHWSDKVLQSLELQIS